MKKENKKDVAHDISVFLNKHAGNPKMVEVHGYEFLVNRLSEIEINEDSINQVYPDSFQFNGTAVVDRTDPVSKVSTSQRSLIVGMVFFAEDVERDLIMIRATLDNIKDHR